MTCKKIVFLALLPLLALSVSACSFSTGLSGESSAGPDLGGVFLSTDRGVNFKQQVAVPSISGMPGSINSINVRSLVLDPSDSTAIYLASYEQGLFFSYNITTGWEEAKTFPKVTVTDIAVNPSNKCDIYSTFANRLYRSVDCARTWKQIYLDADANAIFTTLAIDFYNPSNLYLGTTNGDILKSIDGGTSWRVIKRLNEAVAKLILSPKDSRQVYVADRNAKLYTFLSNTNTDPNTSADIDSNFAVDNWTDLNVVLNDLQIGSTFKDLVIVPADGSIFLATESSIVKSPDHGVTWQKLKLLPSEKDVTIRAMAVNPKDSKQIYYATSLTFFRSIDGGASWSNKKLPTSRAASTILVDYKNPNNIYLGVKAVN
jgi:BNR/Asp-box repeat.